MDYGFVISLPVDGGKRKAYPLPDAHRADVARVCKETGLEVEDLVRLVLGPPLWTRHSDTAVTVTLAFDREAARVVQSGARSRGVPVSEYLWRVLVLDRTESWLSDRGLIKHRAKYFRRLASVS